MTDSAAARRTDWRRAWKALQGLIADPERTELVFEIVDALSGPTFERAFTRFRAHPDGQRILAERRSLLDTLADRDRLRAMPVGSLGRAYADFMDTAQLDADGLVKASDMAYRPDRPPLDAERELFGNRLRDMHDLWHVLTGYGRDEAGEVANLAFTHAQVPSRGVLLIVLAAAVLGPKSIRFWWPRYLLQAWRRGRNAAWLPAVRWEDVLERPIEEVRRELRIASARESHPGGILVANRASGTMQASAA